MKLSELLLILTTALMALISSIASAEMKKDEYKCNEAESAILVKAQNACNFTLTTTYILGETPRIGPKHARIVNGQVGEYCNAQVFFICIPSDFAECGRQQFLVGELGHIASQSDNYVERQLARKDLERLTHSKACFKDAKANTEFDHRFYGEPTKQATVGQPGAAR